MILNDNDIDILISVCNASIPAFKEYATKVLETTDGPAIYIDRGANLLGVGHLDCVLQHKPTFTQGKDNDNPSIWCGQLDDRLGVWGLLHLLPLFTTVPYDVMLCDSEEVGRSTAGSAKELLPDRYNWIFELDRAGVDVVTYDYDGTQWENALKGAGFKIGHGTYSDISRMEYLGICGVNVGIGYERQHTINCHADLDTTVAQCKKFADFMFEHQDTKFRHTPSAYPRNYYGYSNYSHKNWNRIFSKELAADTDTIITVDNTAYDDSCVMTCKVCGEVHYDYRAKWIYCPCCGDIL